MSHSVGAPRGRPSWRYGDVVAESPGTLVKKPKSEATRALIVETALRLFQEHGYAKTTMRAIAKEAGVSVGNAYYYFSSKEQLVQGFYDRIAELHELACEEALRTEHRFAPRLRAVMHGWLDVAAPYHEFGKQFFVNAADPDSPLSPFSSESTPARDAQIALHRRVLDGSSVKVDTELRPELPELLWLYEMGVVLFWVHDRSPNCRKTRLLVDRTVPLIDRVIGLSRLRLLRPVTREIVELIGDLVRPDA